MPVDRILDSRRTMSFHGCFPGCTLAYCRRHRMQLVLTDHTCFSEIIHIVDRSYLSRQIIPFQTNYRVTCSRQIIPVPLPRMTVKIVPVMTYNVFGGTINNPGMTVPIPDTVHLFVSGSCSRHADHDMSRNRNYLTGTCLIFTDLSSRTMHCILASSVQYL